MNTLPLELLGEITASVQGDFIAWTSACKTLNAFNTGFERAKRSNHLLALMSMYPETKWKYDYISSNPNTTWDFVEANSHKPWNYDNLSSNPNITWDIIGSNPDRPWNYSWLSGNSNITWEIMQDNPDIPWNYVSFSYNPNITWEIVKDNPQIKCFKGFSRNKFNAK